jgi:hypothetical protein
VNFVEEEEDKNIVDNILRKTRETFKKIEKRHEREREEKIQEKIKQREIHKKSNQ